MVRLLSTSSCQVGKVVGLTRTFLLNDNDPAISSNHWGHWEDVSACVLGKPSTEPSVSGTLVSLPNHIPPASSKNKAGQAPDSLLTSVQGRQNCAPMSEHPRRLTFEALDWLKRSFCSKILEYFFRSFLIC